MKEHVFYLYLRVAVGKPVRYFVILSLLILVCVGRAGAANPADSLSRKLKEREFRRLIEYGYDIEQYQQSALQLVDPVGDAYLIRQLDTIPVKLLGYIASGTLPQSDVQRQRDSSFRIGRTVPIDTEQLLRDCAQVMRRHFPSVCPYLGEEHRWSDEARNYLRYGFFHRMERHIAGWQREFPAPLFGRSKLFLCLACGWTSRFCVTGCEEALKDRLMAYPDRGVQPLDVFAESYVLNKGNIYLTFLTCENVLAGRPHRKGRELDPLQRKLAYIRHDSKELGDNYGAWYHLFGIALYAVMRTDIESNFVAGAESFGSFFLEGPDRQEYYFNRYGAVFGQEFRKMLDSGGWWLL